MPAWDCAKGVAKSSAPLPCGLRPANTTRIPRSTSTRQARYLVELNANEAFAPGFGSRQAAGPRQRPCQPRPELQRRDPDRAAGVAQLAVVEHLLPSLRHLRGSSTGAAGRWPGWSNGRTHLMDAMPLTFQQALDLVGATAVRRGPDRRQPQRLRRLPLGGTAIVTVIIADRVSARRWLGSVVVHQGPFESGQQVRRLASQDDAVELSGQLNALAVALIRSPTICAGGSGRWRDWARSSCRRCSRAARSCRARSTR